MCFVPTHGAFLLMGGRDLMDAFTILKRGGNMVSVTHVDATTAREDLSAGPLSVLIDAAWVSNAKDSLPHQTCRNQLPIPPHASQWRTSECWPTWSGAPSAEANHRSGLSLRADIRCVHLPRTGPREGKGHRPALTSTRPETRDRLGIRSSSLSGLMTSSAWSSTQTPIGRRWPRSSPTATVLAPNKLVQWVDRAHR